MPEVFDRVVQRSTKAADQTDVERVARRYGIVLDPAGSSRGRWLLMALLLGEADPLDKGANAVRMRATREGYDVEARLSGALAGFRQPVAMRVTLDRPGLRSVNIDVVVDVAGEVAPETEAKARLTEVFDKLAAQGMLPDNVELDFTARRK